MKKLLVVIMIIFFQNTFGMIPESPFAPLLLKENKATELLAQLLEATKTTCDKTLPSIVEATQEAWLRKPHQERWQMGDPNGMYKDDVLPLLDKLGITASIDPEAKEYDYAIILGATVTTIEDRLAQLKKYLDKDIRIKKLILLTGQRDLTDDEKKYMANQGAPNVKTETDAMKFIAKAEPFKHIECTLVDTPKQQTSNGSLRRPNTADTVANWIAQSPAPGSILAISSQPFVAYQDTSLRTYLPRNFSLETVGDIDPRERTTSLFLDTIARWLYQENLRQETLKN